MGRQQWKRLRWRNRAAGLLDLPSSCCACRLLQRRQQQQQQQLRTVITDFWDVRKADSLDEQYHAAKEFLQCERLNSNKIFIDLREKE